MVRRLNALFVPAVGRGLVAQSQLPVVLGESRPEPDLSVVADDAARATASRFVVEVADSSLEYDTTTKRDLFGRHGVEDYWVVNLPAREIWIYEAPDPAGGYRSRRKLQAGDVAHSPNAPCPVNLTELFDGL